jgi:hypothetical protein
VKMRACIAVIVFLVIVLSGIAEGCSSSSSGDAGRVLQMVHKGIREEMERLDKDLGSAAQKLAGQDLDSPQSRSILSALLPRRPYIVDACTINRSGTIIAIEPADFRDFENADISQQEQVIRLFRTLKPVLSQNFRAVEGFEAADLEYPVFSADSKSADKDISGSVSILFKPEILIGNVVAPAIKNTTFSIMLMQPDGRIIYETDSSQIGRNTFVDPLYQSFPQLLSLGREVSANDTGVGQYQFLDPSTRQKVNKEALWTTFSLHRAEWRIVLIHTIF